MRIHSCLTPAVDAVVTAMWFFLLFYCSSGCVLLCIHLSHVVSRRLGDPDETLSKLTVFPFLLMKKKIKGRNKRTIRRNVVVTTCPWWVLSCRMVVPRHYNAAEKWLWSSWSFQCVGSDVSLRSFVGACCSCKQSHLEVYAVVWEVAHAVMWTLLHLITIATKWARMCIPCCHPFSV